MDKDAPSWTNVSASCRVNSRWSVALTRMLHILCSNNARSEKRKGSSFESAIHLSMLPRSKQPKPEPSSQEALDAYQEASNEIHYITGD